MKKLFLFGLLFVASQSLHAQKSVDRFIDQLKKDDKSYVMTIPGWLIRTGIDVADEKELRFEKGFGDIVDGIKKLRVLFLDREKAVPRSELNSVIKQIKDRDGYQDYAKVKDNGADVHVIVKEKNDSIKSLVVMASSEDGFTILNLSTNIKMEDLKKADLSFNKSR